MSGELVLSERRGPVLVLTLNRPDRLNAWTDALEDEYYALLKQAEADPDVRAVVVTGAGRGFCAGADMSDLERISEDGALPGRVDPRPLRTYPMTVTLPLVAAINGATAGLGLVEALYCDVRFSVPLAKFTTAFARRGLVGEYGIAWLLPRLVGMSAALDLLMSGRVVQGEEALQMGLVNRLVAPEDLLDAAVEYATELATLCSPWSMATMKSQVHRSLDQDFASSIEESEGLMAGSFERPDLTEGVRSYLEGRAPSFPPLTS